MGRFQAHDHHHLRVRARATVRVLGIGLPNELYEAQAMQVALEVRGPLIQRSFPGLHRMDTIQQSE